MTCHASFLFSAYEEASSEGSEAAEGQRGEKGEDECVARPSAWVGRREEGYVRAV